MRRQLKKIEALKISKQETAIIRMENKESQTGSSHVSILGKV